MTDAKRSARPDVELRVLARTGFSRRRLDNRVRVRSGFGGRRPPDRFLRQRLRNRPGLEASSAGDTSPGGTPPTAGRASHGCCPCVFVYVGPWKVVQEDLAQFALPPPSSLNARVRRGRGNSGASERRGAVEPSQRRVGESRTARLSTAAITKSATASRKSLTPWSRDMLDVRPVRRGSAVLAGSRGRQDSASAAGHIDRLVAPGARARLRGEQAARPGKRLLRRGSSSRRAPLRKE